MWRFRTWDKVPPSLSRFFGIRTRNSSFDSEVRRMEFPSLHVIGAAYLTFFLVLTQPFTYFFSFFSKLNRMDVILILLEKHSLPIRV